MMEYQQRVKLEQEIEETLQAIEQTTESIRVYAEKNGLSLYDLRTSQGDWLMASLLASKVKLLVAIVDLNT